MRNRVHEKIKQIPPLHSVYGSLSLKYSHQTPCSSTHLTPASWIFKELNSRLFRFHCFSLKCPSDPMFIFFQDLIWYHIIFNHQVSLAYSDRCSDCHLFDDFEFWGTLVRYFTLSLSVGLSNVYLVVRMFLRWWPWRWRTILIASYQR